MINVNIVNAEIKMLTDLLAQPIGIKHFPSLLENEFQQDYLKNHYHTARLTLLLGFFLFTCGSIFIIAFFENWFFPFSVSIFMVSPVLIILLFLCYTKLYSHFQQIIVLIFALTILIGLAVIAAVAPQPLKDLVYQGMLLPSLFVTTLAYLQFRYAIYILIVMMISSNISYYFSDYYGLHDYYDLLVNNYLLLGGSSLCVVGAYYYESYSRKNFLNKKLINAKNQLLKYISHYDALTEIPNKRYFDLILDKEWRRARREKQPLGLVFLDFDYFKQYNDLYGHTIGDNALHSIGQALASCLKRSGDFVARFGGDEFIMILPNTPLNKSIEFAKMIHSAVINLKIPHADSKVAKFVTVTIGVASLVPERKMSSEILLRQADNALNHGKKFGRNKIYSDPPL